MPSLSVIVPTRNRADLWSRRWLLDSLIAQDDPPDELIIAVDHSGDDTDLVILEEVRKTKPPFRVRVLEVLTPRPEPFPASGIPDNCLFHAAASDILLHLDDDLRVPPHLCRQTRTLFESMPAAVIWYLMTFVDELEVPLPDGTDWRIRHIEKHLWPPLPGSLVQPPPNSGTFTGAVFATPAHCIRKIGGHALESCGYHNQDTRLGNRLARRYPSYLSTSSTTTALHLGLTWHMQNMHNVATLRTAYGPARDPKIANGGDTFWTSSWFDTAYRVSFTLDAPNRRTTIA